MLLFWFLTQICKILQGKCYSFHFKEADLESLIGLPKMVEQLRTQSSADDIHVTYIICVLIFRASIWEYNRLSGLTICFLSVLEASSLRSRCHQCWFLVRAFFLACWRPPSLPVLTWPTLYKCVRLEEVRVRGGQGKRKRTEGHALVFFAIFIRTLVLWDYGPIVTTSFYFNYLLKGHISKYSDIRVRALTYKFGEDITQSPVMPLWRSSCFIWQTWLFLDYFWNFYSMGI